MTTLKKSFEEPPLERMMGGPRTRQVLRPKHKKRWFDEQDPHEAEERAEAGEDEDTEAG